ncbi:MAG: acyl-CoA thioesterase, partial [Chloroflexi bacterium]|nr:acyl-CoA thioesterase [Chloroflexota bacterium]
MTGFRFSLPIAVRYSDLDAQGHVNHATYFSFMEQARSDMIPHDYHVHSNFSVDGHA